MSHRLAMRTLCIVASIGTLAGCTTPPPPPTAPQILELSVAGGPFSDPALVPVSWRVIDVNGDVLTCRLDIDGDQVWDEVMSPCRPEGARNVGASAGSHSATLEVSDPDHPPVSTSVVYSVDSGGASEPYDIVLTQTTPYDARVAAAIDVAVAQWEAIIARGVPDARVQRSAESCWVGSPEIDELVDDILVLLSVIPIEGSAGGAGYCVLGPDDLPRFGNISLGDSFIEYADEHGILDDLVAHELGHALGFTGHTWVTFLRDGFSRDPRFIGPRAVAEWSTLGGDGTVPLEPENGGGHWNESIFRNELMTCSLEAGVSGYPLSRLTVASMADVGYQVNMSAADPYELPPQPAPWEC